MIHLITVVAIRRQRIAVQNIRADAGFFAARQLTNFKYGNAYRNKGGGNKCGGGSATLKIARRKTSEVTTDRTYLSQQEQSATKGKCLRMRRRRVRRRAKRDGEKERTRWVERQKNEMRGQGGDIGKRSITFH